MRPVDGFSPALHSSGARSPMPYWLGGACGLVPRKSDRRPAPAHTLDELEDTGAAPGRATGETAPTSPALALGNKQDVAVDVDVAEPQAERFAKSQAGAVEDKQQGAIKRRPEIGSPEGGSAMENAQDVFL